MLDYVLSFFRPSVAKITASLDKMVAKLDAHGQASALKASFHRDLANLHADETLAAGRIRAKIAELLA